MRMQYYGALSIKSAPLSFAFFAGILLMATYAAVMTLFSNFLGMSVETGVTLFYAVVTLALIVPGLPGYDTRKSFFRTLYICFFPLNAITFPEVLLADALTSMSKVLKDLGVTAVAVYAQTVGAPLVTYHNEGMILVAVLASLPFAYVPLLSPLAAIFHTSPAHPPTFPPLTFHVQVSASGNAGCSWTGRRTTG